MDGIETLKAQLAAGGWTADADIIAPHLVEWRDKYFGHTPIMLTPRNTDEVVQMVKICAAHGLKIVPQGGNTGLVGGQTPMGEVLISMSKMSIVRALNPTNNSIVIEAGATLGALHDAAESVDRLFPLSLASQGSCTVGGIISTNAGGVHVLKYGTTKDMVFGLEVVLADGTVFNGLTDLAKDNTGYDLSRLFIGAEGTLGIITAASMKLQPRPRFVQRAMVGIGSPQQALELLELARNPIYGSGLAMFEVMPEIALDLVLADNAGTRTPFAAKHKWLAVLDFEANSPEQGAELAQRCLAKAMEAGCARDAVIAKSETEAAQILALREGISAAQKQLGGSIKFDISVPIQAIPTFLKTADAAVQNFIQDARPVAFGHFGDGNIHYNIGRPEAADKDEFLGRWQALSEIVFDVVEEYGGSISAEHGIGVMKRGDLARRADPVKLSLLKSLKNALDPDNIMNPRVLI